MADKDRKDGKDADMEKMCNGRIENARKRLAKLICSLDSVTMDVKSACELMDWNEDVAYEMENALGKLGTCLATLDCWFDDINGQEIE